MQLTKEQIQEIDIRLKKDGIKYWDIRIEILDHVVTDVEIRLDKGEELEKAITNSFICLGWNGDFKHVNKKGWQDTNDRYRREHFKGMISCFKNIKNSFKFLLSIMLLYVLSELCTFKTFKISCMILFNLPVLLIVFIFIKSALKKYGKSVNLDYAFFYLGITFMLLPGLISLVETCSEPIKKTTWIVVLSIHFLSMYSGYNIYRKTITSLENMHKQLLK